MPNGEWDHEEILRLRGWRHDHGTTHYELGLRLTVAERALERLEQAPSRHRSTLRLVVEVVVAACAVAALILPLIRT